MSESDPIEIDEDADSARRNWVFERVGFAAFTVFVIAAGFGALGGGPLATATFPVDDGSIRYPRICRAGKSTTLEFNGIRNAREILLGSDISSGLKWESISPEPESQEVTVDGIRFRFRTDDTDNDRIIFHVQPVAPGVLRDTATVGQVAEQEIAIYVLP